MRVAYSSMEKLLYQMILIYTSNNENYLLHRRGTSDYLQTSLTSHLGVNVLRARVCDTKPGSVRMNNQNYYETSKLINLYFM